MIPPRFIFLMGFMGVGKSTVGPLFAKNQNLPFWDMDVHLEQITGFPIAVLFDKGENYFRRVETLLFKQLVAQERGVIALGGGIPLREENQHILQTKGPVVWLDADPWVLFQRMRIPQAQKTRPLLKSVFSSTPSHFSSDFLHEPSDVLTKHLSPEEQAQYAVFLSIYQKRASIYEKLSWLRIDTSFLSPPQVAEKLVEIFQKTGKDF